MLLTVAVHLAPDLPSHGPVFVVGLLIVVGNLGTAAAVVLGFISYVTTLVDMHATPIAVIALIVATLIALSGVRGSVRPSSARLENVESCEDTETNQDQQHPERLDQRRDAESCLGQSQRRDA